MNVRTSEPMLTILRKPPKVKKEKMCYKCGELKSWEELTYNGKRWKPEWMICNKCRYKVEGLEYKKKWFADNPDKYNEYVKRRRPKQIQYNIKRYRTDPEHRKKQIEYAKDYYRRNAEKQRRLRRERYYRDKLKKLHQEQEVQATDAKGA